MKFNFKLVTLGILPFILLSSCRKSEVIPRNTDGLTEVVSFQNIPGKKPILADNENKTIIYARSFNVRHLLSVASGTNDSLRVTNYSPIGFKNVTVYASLKGYAEPIKLMHLDSVGALAEFSYKASFVNNSKSYYTQSGKMVKVSNISTIDSATFSLDSPDTLFVKLKNIKADWTVHLDLKGVTGQTGWQDMNPVHGREYVVMFTNFAYLFSSTEWQNDFLAYEGLVDNSGAPITRDGRAAIIQKILGMTKFDTGIVGGDVGLGGGTVLGVAEYVQLYQYTQGHSDVFYHELGHCLGYSHASNMTYPQNGKSSYYASLPSYGLLYRQRRMPFWNYKTLNTLYIYTHGHVPPPGTLIEAKANETINYETY